MHHLFDTAWSYGPWGAATLFTALLVVWALLLWALGYWLKRARLHKGHVIAQAQMVLFLLGCTLLMNLIFVPFVLIVIPGAAFGILLIVMIQTILFLAFNTERRRSGGRLYGDDPGDSSGRRDVFG
jgi:uncharacterized membrane protein